MIEGSVNVTVMSSSRNHDQGTHLPLHEVILVFLPFPLLLSVYITFSHDETDSQ